MCVYGEQTPTPNLPLTLSRLLLPYQGSIQSAADTFLASSSSSIYIRSKVAIPYRTKPNGREGEDGYTREAMTMRLRGNARLFCALLLVLLCVASQFQRGGGGRVGAGSSIKGRSYVRGGGGGYVPTRGYSGRNTSTSAQHCRSRTDTEPRVSSVAVLSGFQVPPPRSWPWRSFGGPEHTFASMIDLWRRLKCRICTTI